MCNQDCLNCTKKYCTRTYSEKSLYKNRSEKAKQHNKDYARKKYYEAKAKGLCTICKKKKAKYGVKCYECYIRQKRYDREKYRRDDDLKREHWRENGLCYFCGSAVLPGKKTCKKHYSIMASNALWASSHPNTVEARKKNRIIYGRKAKGD